MAIGDYPATGLETRADWGYTNKSNLTNTLNGAINDTALTIVLTSAAAFPAQGLILIDSEEIFYSSKSSNTLTVSSTAFRGLSGTSAASHINGSTVTLADSGYTIDAIAQCVTALQAKVGINSSAVTTTLDYLAKSATARVYLNANQSIPNNTLTKILFDTESWDTGSNFASNKFTAPVAGKYQVNATISWGANGTERRGVQIYKNGVSHTATIVQANPAASGGCVVNVSDILSLAATDYVEVYGLQTSGASLDANSGASDSSMSIALIKL